MANGNTREYNPGWCNERHERIDERFSKMDTRLTELFNKLDNRMWAGLTLLVLNLITIILTFITIAFD